MPARTEPRPPVVDVAAYAAGIIIAIFATVAMVGVAQAQRGRSRDLPEIRAEAAQLFELEFQIEHGDRQRDHAALKDRFESALRSQVAKLDRRYGLSEPQVKKLLLAGRVDIEHHFERVDELEHRLSNSRRGSTKICGCIG